MTARRKRLDRAMQEQVNRFARSCNDARQKDIEVNRVVDQQLKEYLGFDTKKQGERKKNRRWRKSATMARKIATTQQRELMRVFNETYGAPNERSDELGERENTTFGDNPETSNSR